MLWLCFVAEHVPYQGLGWGFWLFLVCVVPVVGFNLRLRVLAVHSLCG